MSHKPPKQDPLVGHVLDNRYKILEFVREEELGKVYNAVQLPEEVQVSVKVLHPHLVEDPEAFGRFGREMLATATIQHPNAIQMFDFGQHRGVFHFIVLERVWAKSLTEILKESGPMHPDRAIHVAAQVASCMAAAHHEGIVHRNLNPQNILLLDNAVGADYVKIRDFGLSRLHDREGNIDGGGLTAVGARVGTANYMAPEYISESIVDPRGDLYALGIVLYEMIVGEPPFVGKAGAVMEMHVEAPVPAPSARVRGIPRWLEDLIMGLLEKDPTLRPRSASEVLTRLQQGTGKRLDPPQLSAAPVKKKAGKKGAAEDGEGGSNKTMLVVLVAGIGILTLVGIFAIVAVALGLFAAS